MSFVQAGFLIACAAVAIPVLVHLLSRWQVKRIELGTMRFLQEVIHEFFQFFQGITVGYQFHAGYIQGLQDLIHPVRVE